MSDLTNLNWLCYELTSNFINLNWTVDTPFSTQPVNTQNGLSKCDLNFCCRKNHWNCGALDCFRRVIREVKTVVVCGGQGLPYWDNEIIECLSLSKFLKIPTTPRETLSQGWKRTITAHSGNLKNSEKTMYLVWFQTFCSLWLDQCCDHDRIRCQSVVH